jgi:exopolysaccharide production protein ExoQ
MQQVGGGSDYIGARPWASLAPPLASPTWETVLVVVVAIILGTKAVEIVAGGGAPNPAQVKVVFMLAYGVFALLLARSARRVLPLLLTAPLLLLVLLFPPISMLWSVNPGETIERSLALLGTSIFGLYLAWRFTLGRIIFLLAVALMGTVWLSLLMIIFAPSIGIDQSGSWAGTWKGIHFHKNALGATSGLACLVLGYAITDNRGGWRIAFVLTFVLAVMLLLGSRSTSSILMTSTLGILVLWARFMQTMPMQIPVLSLIVALGVLVAAVGMITGDVVDGFLGLFGKTRNFSGRIPLWGILWAFIQERFWLGYGYEAFWSMDSPQRFIKARLYLTPFYSHNGLLETWLNGGAVLVALLLSLLGVTIINSMILFFRWRALAISSFPLMFCGYFIAVNLTESTALAYNELTWSLFVAFALFVTKWVRWAKPHDTPAVRRPLVW